MITLGETAHKVRHVSAEDIKVFANICEDFNPLHHDADYAAASRFGGIIASGPHYVSLLMGLLATHFAQHGPQVGVECAVRFVKPVRAGDTLEYKWVVVAIEPKSRGDIVSLEGSITNQTGETVLAATSKILAIRE